MKNNIANIRYEQTTEQDFEIQIGSSIINCLCVFDDQGYLSSCQRYVPFQKCQTVLSGNLMPFISCAYAEELEQIHKDSKND